MYETTEVLLPAWFRCSRLYRAMVANSLRITVELIGGVSDSRPPDPIGARDLAMRKAAGNLIELSSVAAIGWSPLWLLAAAADLTGGTRTYLRALVSELHDSGLLPKRVDVSSVDGLFSALEGTSGAIAEGIDVPPLNLRDMRISWRALQQSAAEVPGATTLAGIFTQLQQVAKQEKRSLLSVSSLIAAGAVRAGARMGQTYLFDYYRDALGLISQEGLPAYSRRVAKPYLDATISHFDSRRLTYIERLPLSILHKASRLLGRLFRRR